MNMIETHLVTRFACNAGALLRHTTKQSLT